jgi:hypothetical protein
MQRLLDNQQKEMINKKSLSTFLFSLSFFRHHHTPV